MNMIDGKHNKLAEDMCETDKMEIRDTNKEFYIDWTKEHLRNECARLNRVLQVDVERLRAAAFTIKDTRQDKGEEETRFINLEDSVKGLWGAGCNKKSIMKKVEQALTNLKDEN